jgi:ferrous iron transport protein B
MSSQPSIRIALVGNPNIGKTTLFNKLCGLNQRTGNYPGVTVDKKKGAANYKGQSLEIIDLPGINSLYPKSKDEELVVKYLLDTKNEEYPHKFVVVVSALNLKRNLYLLDQVKDLNIPIVLAVNMIDLAEKRGIFIDFEALSNHFNVPVLPISAKKSTGIDQLKDQLLESVEVTERAAHYLEEAEKDMLSRFRDIAFDKNDYKVFLRLTQNLDENPQVQQAKDTFIRKEEVNLRKLRKNAAILRYRFVNEGLKKALTIDKSKAVDLTTRADRLLMHPIWGQVTFLLVLLAVFQAIFWLASFPMDWIDIGFGSLAEWSATALPEGYLSQLITEGLIPGIGGVVIFIPQIAILFFLFSLLEESGYMSRIIFLNDRVMQKFGMSGKSIVPMISGMACAIPAIMAARTIENSRERLITILVTPLLTCSARIPVYVLVIALVIPDDTYIWIFNAQGLALMAMYLLGVLMTFIVALVLKGILKPVYKSYLLLELPEYLIPDMKNVLVRVWNNVKSFIWNAGKIIVATAIILFVLATNGGEEFQQAEVYVQENHATLSTEEQAVFLSSYQIEKSYLGQIGKTIEPAIEPLGYDWKIGISLVTSLAAREVFVGTMSIIYAIDSEETMTIRDRLKKEVNPSTGMPVFGLATSVSLLIFYAFALQCMSTVAVTYKETKSFKWTAIQFGYMTALAYFGALIAYQILS